MAPKRCPSKITPSSYMEQFRFAELLSLQTAESALKAGLACGILIFLAVSLHWAVWGGKR